MWQRFQSSLPGGALIVVSVLGVSYCGFWWALVDQIFNPGEPDSQYVLSTYFPELPVVILTGVGAVVGLLVYSVYAAISNATQAAKDRTQKRP